MLTVDYYIIVSQLMQAQHQRDIFTSNMSYKYVN